MELNYAPMTPFMVERVPGMSPIGLDEWLHRDEAFAAQMAYRDRLVVDAKDIVLKGEGGVGASELLDLVLASLADHDPAYRVGETSVERPDGVTVEIDRARPFATVARLTQTDLLMLTKPEGGDEHVLTGGALLFPSRWSFDEKLNRPLVGIHDRVPAYDDGLARRVQRLFDALQPDKPLVRANWLVHPDPELHQPKLYVTVKKPHEESGRYWLRVERQTLLRLPRSGNVVFGVKTFITPVEALSAQHLDGLIAGLAGQTPEMQDYHGGLSFTRSAIENLKAMRAG